MVLEKLSPILPSRDIDCSERFYTSLGFHTIGKYNDYLLMKRENAEVHFFHKSAHDPSACDHGAYLRPSNVNEFSAEIEELGLPSFDDAPTAFPRFQPAEDKPWGMREATLVDPDGNLIRAGQEISDWPGAPEVSADDET